MTTLTFPLTFPEALAAYIKTVQAMNNAYYDTNFPDCPAVKAPLIVAEEGKRYVRIVKADTVGTGRSVHTFVDKTNGVILKGNWKAPVKNGARGNIFTDYTKSVNWHGAVYLR